MQYNGGKSRIGKRVADFLRDYRRGARLCWEPFCGGLGVTQYLLPDLASDIHAGLIALYERTRSEPGWLDASRFGRGGALLVGVQGLQAYAGFAQALRGVMIKRAERPRRA